MWTVVRPDGPNHLGLCALQNDMKTQVIQERQLKKKAAKAAEGAVSAHCSRLASLESTRFAPLCATKCG